MLLLNNLSESGYNQLKKDRDILINEIEQLNSILSEFDLAYPYLSSIYDPKVQIKLKEEKYFGYIKLTDVNNKFFKRSKFFIGSEEQFEGKYDPLLIEKAYFLAKEEIKKIHPEMFEDAGQ
jgi:hypothetical protein